MERLPIEPEQIKTGGDALILNAPAGPLILDRAKIGPKKHRSFGLEWANQKELLPG
jgi:hypothetical protein